MIFFSLPFSLYAFSPSAFLVLLIIFSCSSPSVSFSPCFSYASVYLLLLLSYSSDFYSYPGFLSLYPRLLPFEPSCFTHLSFQCIRPFHTDYFCFTPYSSLFFCPEKRTEFFPCPLASAILKTEQAAAMCGSRRRENLWQEMSGAGNIRSKSSCISQNSLRRRPMHSTRSAWRKSLKSSQTAALMPIERPCISTFRNCRTSAWTSKP